MKKGCIFFLLIFSIDFYPQPVSHLILSEIMFYGESGNNEFIEIYNPSSTETFDLTSYRIKVQNYSNDLILNAGSGTLLTPRSYAVILEGDYDIISGIYAPIIPQAALILKISDNAFGSGGMSNTSDRTIYLINSDDDTIDAGTYTADNSSGISEERIFLIGDTSNSNWSNSLKQGGTPGFKNSITPSELDLCISSVCLEPAVLFEGNDANIQIIINNSGMNTADRFQVEIFNDTNNDSSGTESEKFYSEERYNLPAGDSCKLNVRISGLEKGSHYIICSLLYPPDEDQTDNIFFKEFFVHSPGNNYNDAIINEFMYAPASGETEWIEILNRSRSSINLKNWKIGDNSNSSLINSEVIIKPDSFLVVSKDSSILNYYSVLSQLIYVNFPTLNNSGDAVVVRDSLGILIDSVQYLTDWGGSEGNSLERIDPGGSSNSPLNWSNSANKNKATPGFSNSISKKDFDLELTGIANDPAFPVFGDNISFTVKIKNLGKNSSNFDLILSKDIDLDSIPDTQLERINPLQIPPGDSAVIKFNYTEHNLQSNLNFFCIIIDKQDQDTSNNYLFKLISPGFPVSTIAINEVMYSPVNGEPEWIELYNTVDKPVNLKNWEISDILTLPARSKITEDIYIPGKSFLLISKDSSILNYHRLITSEIFVFSFPNLNNDDDGIVLKDDRGQRIDSINYESGWGKTGHSLERISITAGSTLNSNWTPSTDIEMSTPGRINTAAPKLYDLSVSDIFFNPRFPVNGENVFVHTNIKNHGSLTAGNFWVNFFLDPDLDGIFDQSLGSVQFSILNPGDSVTVSSKNPIINIYSKISAAVQITFTLDEDTLNNYAEKKIEPGFPKNTVLLNEIMFDPEQNEPEWIEIINASSDSINLINWSVSDILPSPAKNFLTNRDLFIAPGEYVIIAKDTSFLSLHPETNCKIIFTSFGTLGSSSDGVMVYDFRNAVIDSMLYKASWETMKGFSLERISFLNPACDSSNWIVSLSEKKSTPGLPNSVIGIPQKRRNSLVINEIMFDPDIDNCEFIEFYNDSEDEINTGGWKIEDGKGNYFKICKANFLVPPDSFFVIFADSLGAANYNLTGNTSAKILNRNDLGLNNSEELILLKDLSGRVIDSVQYSGNWHNANFPVTKDRSLERINPKLNGNEKLNWSSSVDFSGATPGRRNSIFTDNLYKAEAKISVSPNPFSPDGDGFEDFSILNYKLSKPTAQVRLKIFDSRGRLVRTLLNNQPAGSENSLVFDGLEDSGSPLRIGIYIIFLEALDISSGTTEVLKTTVVVARKLN